MTKEEFIQRLVDNGWDYCSYFYKVSFYTNGISIDLPLLYGLKYTEANLQELINASKVYERLEKVE